jgi:hypothetical protein
MCILHYLKTLLVHFTVCLCIYIRVEHVEVDGRSVHNIDGLITGALALISRHSVGALELGDYIDGFITQSKSTLFICSSLFPTVCNFNTWGSILSDRLLHLAGVT